MSNTFNIGCVDCRMKLWIGQRDYIYSAPEYLQRLSGFLLEHKGHKLIVADEHMSQLDDFMDVWDYDAPESPSNSRVMHD